MNRGGRAGPSVFSAGSLMSIAADCSSKGWAIRQRYHTKGGSMLDQSQAVFVSVMHTYTEPRHMRAHTTHTYSSFSHFAVAAEASWARIGWRVILKCGETLFSKWQEGGCQNEWAPLETFTVMLWCHSLRCGINRNKHLSRKECEMCSCGFSVWIFGDLCHGKCQLSFRSLGKCLNLKRASFNIFKMPHFQAMFPVVNVSYSRLLCHFCPVLSDPCAALTFSNSGGHNNFHLLIPLLTSCALVHFQLQCGFQNCHNLQ